MNPFYKYFNNSLKVSSYRTYPIRPRFEGGGVRFDLGTKSPVNVITGCTEDNEYEQQLIQVRGRGGFSN